MTTTTINIGNRTTTHHAVTSTTTSTTTPYNHNCITITTGTITTTAKLHRSATSTTVQQHRLNRRQHARDAAKSYAEDSEPGALALPLPVALP